MGSQKRDDHVRNIVNRKYFYGNWGKGYSLHL